MSSSPIELLPPELLANVFDALSKDCRDIQTCRLVCKVFRELSSHHLITRVVIAERYESLQRVQWIINHPFFSKHVTHLVWDVSHFQRSLAYDLRLYGDAFQASAGNWNTPKLEEAWRGDRRSLSKLLRYDPRETTSSLPGDEYLEWENDSDISEMDEYEHGRHLVGFPLYHQRYDRQRTCRERKLTSRYLRFAIDKLPKLRHIDYTDFRILSLQGESFQDLCQRLFGESVHPTFMCLTSDETSRWLRDEESRDTGLECLDAFIKQVVSLDWRPESFSIGRNNFDLPELDVSHLYDYGSTTNSSSLTRTKLLRDEELQWFASLKSLHLPVIPLNHLTIPSPPHPERSSYTTILTSITASIEHLGLVTDSYARSPQVSLTEWPYALSVILGPLKFEKLVSLELRGWSLTLEELETFVFAHAKTLRYIHLIGCECHGGAYDAALQKIGRDWPNRLSLRGAEVIRLRFPGPAAADWLQAAREHRCNKHVTEKEMPESIRYSSSEPDYHQHPISRCPGPRPEFEKAMLGDRYNNVCRRSPRQPLPDDCSMQWEEIPVNPYG